jgi:hypothetical protein
MSDNGQSENMPESTPPPRSPLGPKCETCGETTILQDYRPHPTLRNHELRTYKCPACAREDVLGSPMPPLD